MIGLLNSLAGPFLMLAPISISVASLSLYKWYERSKNRRNPLRKALLNAPGASLRSELTNRKDDFSALLLLTATLGAYSGGFAVGYGTKTELSWKYWIVAGSIVAVILCYLIFRMTRLLQVVRRLRLGLDGEMATAEELNQLMRLGYHVFHDIPGPNYNIDHAVVGLNGVFAIETKIHSKPAQGHEVDFDGRVLHYPDYHDAKSVEQAQRNARSLGRYLSEATGRKVAAAPLVILPGWYVNHTGTSQSCSVLASGQVQGWLPKLPAGKLTPEEVRAISYQLERLCRGERPVSLSTSDDTRYEQKPAL